MHRQTEGTMGTFGIIFFVLVVIFVIGGALDFLRLFGIHIPEIPLLLLIAGGFAIWNWKRIAKTFDYLFVKYPAVPTPTVTTTGGRPTYQYEGDAARERAVQSKLDADSEIADATIRLERARAALADAEREAAEERERPARRT